MQQQLSDTEQANAKRLIEITTRHRQESELEIERLRTAQIQSERTLEARERAHRQRVKGLEEQVSCDVTLILSLLEQTKNFFVNRLVRLKKTKSS